MALERLVGHLRIRPLPVQHLHHSANIESILYGPVELYQTPNFCGPTRVCPPIKCPSWRTQRSTARPISQPSALRVLCPRAFVFPYTSASCPTPPLALRRREPGRRQLYAAFAPAFCFLAAAL